MRRLVHFQVLQQAPQAAAVYGYLGNSSCKGVAVTVADGKGGTVVAQAVVQAGRWKAVLKPTVAGGPYTITAAGTSVGNYFYVCVKASSLELSSSLYL